MKPRENKEVLLSPIVSNWLSTNGYTVYSELGVWSPIDHVGVRWSDESIICVEMKMSVTWGVLYQARRCQLITPLSYVAVPGKPKAESIEKIKQSGLGLICNGIAVVDPASTKHVLATYRQRILDKCKHNTPGGIGGLPQLKGDGPAIRTRKLLLEYLATHPTASWKELWENVPNHYAHPRSMYGAMRGIRMTE